MSNFDFGFDLHKITGNEPPLETECDNCLELQAEIAQLKAERDALRCCGNCEHLGSDDIDGHFRCKESLDWIYDNMWEKCDDWQPQEQGK